MKDIIIREAKPEDAEELLNYLKQIGGESDNLTFGAEGLPISVEEEKAYLQTVLDDPHSVAYVACKNGKIIGDISLSGFPRRMSHRAELGLSVIKKEWNSGIGSALIKKAIAYAKANGIELINLEVRSDNSRAIHVYEKLGFQKIGISPAFFKHNGKYIDFILMYLDLRI